MGEFSKCRNMIADPLNAIKDGRWADAASIGKQMLNLWQRKIVSDANGNRQRQRCRRLGLKSTGDSIPQRSAERFAAGLG